MTPIDFTNMTAHATLDREPRFTAIENSIGWGNPVVMVPDRKNETATATLTDTGVLIIRGLDNTIITAWVANVRQAVAIWRQATGVLQMPKALWNMVNYNNDTTYWRNLVAA